MKTAVIILAIVALASTAPKATKLTFPNVYKQPIAPPKAINSGRLVGGQEATPHSLNYQVFLEVYDLFRGWYCGGSLISVNYVLTAGQCGFLAQVAYVTLGAHEPLKYENSQVEVVSRNITVHASYAPDIPVNDIAVIRLPSPVTLTDAIGVIPLYPNTWYDFRGETARVSGWGVTSDGAQDLSSVLRYADVKVISNDECAKVFGALPDSLLCTSGENTGTCDGDAGGPLVLEGMQIGLVSYRAEYCDRGYPSVYSRTNEFLKWISNNTDVNVDY